MVNKKNDDWIMWAAAGLVGALALIFGPGLLQGVNNPNVSNTTATSNFTAKKDCGCHMKK
jgi:hypothetical protein